MYLVFAFFLLFYSLTITKNLGVAHDAMSYLVNITRGTDLDHPHHLLYHWTARIWLLLFQLVQIPLSSATTVQLLNVLFGALTMALFYQLLRTSLSATGPMAFMGTLLPAFSYGFWFYTTTIEVYNIPLFLLLLTIMVLNGSINTKFRWYWVGLLHGAAILYHQVNVLFGIVILVFILKFSSSSITIAKQAIRKYLTVVVPMTIIPYLFTYVFIRHFTTFEQCWRWTTAYAQDNRYWIGFDPLFAIKIAKGLVNVFIGGHFIFALPSVERLLASMDRQFYFADEYFLVRDLPTVQATFLLIATLVFFVMIAYLVVNHRSNQKTILPERLRKTKSALVLWLSVYSVFFCFWDVGNIEFWIPQSLILWFLFLIRIRKTLQYPVYEKIRLIPLGILVLSLLTVNWLGSMRWLANDQYDFVLSKTLPIAKYAKPGDVIVTNYSWIVSDYFEYYSPAKMIAVSELFEEYDHSSQLTEVLRNRIDIALSRGNDVYVTQDAVSIDRFTEAHYGERVREIEAVWDSYRTHWKIYPTTIDTFYRIGAMSLPVLK
ncbi:MAG: glycosyltransferase family 39 protein [bacterium]|nr:glycosyltransferase family 39 protein [bacterium]